MLSWASITPFGVPVVPEVKTSSKTSSGVGRRPGGLARLPVGRERRVVVDAGSAQMTSSVVVGKCCQAGLARVGRVAARADDEVARARGLHDVLDRLGRHAQVERHEDEASAHRAEVGRRELRRRRRPGQDPVARLEAERPQPPRRDPAAPSSSRKRPALVVPSSAAQARAAVVAVAGDGLVEQVE